MPRMPKKPELTDRERIERLEEAVFNASETPIKDRMTTALEAMTPKQREVWTLLLKGLEQKQIATLLHLWPNSVRSRMICGQKRAQRFLGWAP